MYTCVHLTWQVLVTQDTVEYRQMCMIYLSVYMCVYVHVRTSYLASAGHTRHGGIPTNVYDIVVCVYVCVCTHAYILLGKCWSHKTQWNTDKCV